MQCSYSRLECFNKCKFQYKLRYLDGLSTIPDESPDNALILGHALHTGIEKGVDAGITEYYNAYPIISDQHINEAEKLQYWISKVREMLPENGCFEVEIADEHFVGFIDYLVPVENGVYDIYDFKYTKDSSRYLQSGQLHLYKWFYEKLHPGSVIRNLKYIIIPKIGIKQKKTETLDAFRLRQREEMAARNVEVLDVTYAPDKVIDFAFGAKNILECEDFPKEPTRLCDWCEFRDYCEKGIDYMLLPKNERRNIENVTKKVIWLYGAPFSGKTTFANAFPDPLMLNTDGNVRFVDAPYLPMKDKVEVIGRMTKRTLAWEIFKETLSELEKKDNEFKTIVVDLVEDLYESCRLYMYEQMGISHESDDSFRAWDKVRTEFLSTMRRFMNLDYENVVLISHVDTSKDITKKGGDKLTAIKPNIQDKIANKLAGMVDIVARVIADGDTRTLSFKTNEVIFGGGRLQMKSNEIPLDYDALLNAYEEYTIQKPTKERKTSPRRSNEAVQEPKQTAEVAPEINETQLAEAVKTAEVETKEAPEHLEPNSGEVEKDATAPKDAPVTRTRRRRGE